MNPLNVISHIARWSLLSAVILISCLYSGSSLAAGYVNGSAPLDQSNYPSFSSDPSIPAFNNDQFTNNLLVGAVNNNRITTPTAGSVSAITGNNFQDETDFRIRGRNNLDFIFSRTYNSSPAAISKDRGLGFGWTHSYMMQLKSNDFGNCPNCPQDLTQGQFSTISTVVSSIPYGSYNVLSNTFNVTASTQHRARLTLYNYISPTDTLTACVVRPNNSNLVCQQLPATYASGYTEMEVLFTPDVLGAHRLRFSGNGADSKSIIANVSMFLTDTNGDGAVSSITYTDERGGEHNFGLNRLHSIATPKGEFLGLSLDSPAAGQHTLSFRNGVKYIFETPTGNLKTTPNVISRLKYIDNVWGDRLTLSYDANGRLSTIADNLAISGRTGLVFSYYTSGTSNGHLQGVTDWSGRSWTFGYDSALNLVRRTNPLQEQLTYVYEKPSSHQLTEIVKPVAREGLAVKTKFSYYLNGRVFSETNSYDEGNFFEYDLFRRNTKVTNARGNSKEYIYDANGRLDKAIQPDGGIIYFENQGDAIRSKKFDAIGYPTTYSYRNDFSYEGVSNTGGNVTRELDALGNTTDITYGWLDQIASFKDKRGITTATLFGSTNGPCDRRYRPREKRISMFDQVADVLLESYCWNGDNTLNYSRRYLSPARYIETTLSYQPGTSNLNIEQEQMVGHPSGVAVTHKYTYDLLGRRMTDTLLRRINPTNSATIELTTRFEYDALDRVTKITDATGNEQINRFDANGQLWQVTHRYKKLDGSYETRNVVTRAFDAADRVISETDAMGFVTTYDYDAEGNVISIVDAENHETTFEYDPMNRRTAMVDATGYRSEMEYSLRGDLIATINANGQRTEHEYNAVGQRVATVDPLGYRTEFGYDANGNLTCIIDANAQAGLQQKNSHGCSEHRAYNELNMVSAITDALGGITNFSYDFLGNRLSIRDAETKTWSFGYDDLGRLNSETDHSLRTITYKQDEAGNIYEKTNRLSEITRYTHDNVNRPTRTDFLKDNTFESYSYYPDGSVELMSNGTVSYSFDYDDLNRLLSKTDSRGRSLSYTYDNVDNVLTKTTYQSSTTSYRYNAANRLVYLSNPDYLEVDYQYDPAGRMLSRVTSSGARTLYRYKDNGALEQLDQYNAAGTQISGTTFTPDRVGNIVARQDGSSTISYGYDALYRLATLNHPTNTYDESFTYDKVGNIKTATSGSLAPTASTRYYNYVIGSNRLNDIRIGSATGTLESGFTFDNDGRLTSQTGVGARTIGWDAKGRVRTLTQAGSSETYTYDPMDHRIGRSGGVLGALNYFLEGEHLESVYKGSSLEAKFMRGSSIDELVAGYLKDTDSKLKPYIFHQDNLTSTTGVSGHNGTVHQSIQYKAFGDVRTNSGTSPNRLKFTGREDDGTGLYYYRARFYDTRIGRFLSEDPLGFAAGVNFYRYANNNPASFSDPYGLDPNVPYGSRDIARIEAGRYVAARTKFNSESREFGVYVYQSGSSFYHTPATIASGKIHEISSADWARIEKFVPIDAFGKEQAHSHPPYIVGASRYHQFPSDVDYSGAQGSATGFGVLGLTDGSVYTFKGGTGMAYGTNPDGSTYIRKPSNQNEAPDFVQIAPPTTLENPYINRVVPSNPSLNSNSINNLLNSNSALYPNQNNTAIIYVYLF
jgi:RHS repeat-associated protein